jgi:hypothetical protein
MTILRGFNFGNFELVTANKLYSLVANASYTNVDWGALLAPGLGVVGASAPTNPGVGSIWSQYEQIVGLETSSYSGQFVDFNIFIQSPQGKVGLFSQNRLESRLGQHMGAVFKLRIGSSVVYGSTFQTGITLCLNAFGNSGNPFQNNYMAINGTSWGFTADTGPSTSGFPRLSLLGVCAYDLFGANPRNTLPYPAFVAIYEGGGQAGKWTSSCCSIANQSFGLLLSDNNVGVSIGWSYGRSLFRAI